MRKRKRVCLGYEGYNCRVDLGIFPGQRKRCDHCAKGHYNEWMRGWRAKNPEKVQASNKSWRVRLGPKYNAKQRAVRRIEGDRIRARERASRAGWVSRVLLERPEEFRHRNAVRAALARKARPEAHKEASDKRHRKDRMKKSRVRDRRVMLSLAQDLQVAF